MNKFECPAIPQYTNNLRDKWNVNINFECKKIILNCTILEINIKMFDTAHDKGFN